MLVLKDEITKFLLKLYNQAVTGQSPVFPPVPISGTWSICCGALCLRADGWLCLLLGVAPVLLLGPAQVGTEPLGSSLPTLPHSCLLLEHLQLPPAQPAGL